MRGWGGTDGSSSTPLSHSPQWQARHPGQVPRVLTTPWREGGMRPQYTGMKVLQTLACKAGAEGGSEQGLGVPLRPPRATLPGPPG